MKALLAWLLGCGAGSEAPSEPVWESLDLRVGQSAHFEKIPGTGRLLAMRTAALPGEGHRALGSFALVWDDGEQRTFEGDLPLVGCSRGYVFVLDGMHASAALVGEGPARACPR